MDQEKKYTNKRFKTYPPQSSALKDSYVEHDSLWETLTQFININREENTRQVVEYYYFVFLGLKT